jgi:hypothetical protein
VEIITEAGLARAELDGDGATARFLLALTHGAGGSVEAPDVLAVRDAAVRLGGMVARVTQPYRVRGGRAPGSAARQDAAWVEIVIALRELPRASPSCKVAGATARGWPAAPPSRSALAPSSRWRFRCNPRAEPTRRGRLGPENSARRARAGPRCSWWPASEIRSGSRIPATRIGSSSCLGRPMR